ncbi:MAG: prepilin peptidase [Bdellovibrionales bacterium]|nr:prepilin peptidase [Bdellovibrionales bacterium]
MIDIAVVLFGLIIGSFLSVCVYRIPLGRSTGLDELFEEEEESDEEGVEEEELGEEDLLNSPHFQKRVTIAYPPRSFCPHCGEKLKWYHNLPVVSYALLLGKCGFCKERISWKYPTIELLSAFFAWLSYATFDPVTAALAYIFAAGLIVISFIDLEYFIIPNVITYPAFVLGILFGVEQTFFGLVKAPPFVPGIVESGIGVLTGAGILLSISLFYTYVRKKQGLGLGDVKLLAVTGAFFGFHGAFYTIFVGSLLGSLLGVAFMLLGRGRWSSYIPFGPYLAAANLLYLYYAQELALFLSQVAVQHQGYQ